MAQFFRLVQARWAHDAMSGEGARLAGGRWNPPGMLAVYLAESRSLAALEVVVHAPREVLRLAPDFSIRDYMQGLSYRNQEDALRVEEGLRKAGLAKGEFPPTEL